MYFVLITFRPEVPKTTSGVSNTFPKGYTPVKFSHKEIYGKNLSSSRQEIQ
jgi:hypothetical protein